MTKLMTRWLEERFGEKHCNNMDIILPHDLGPEVMLLSEKFEDLLRQESPIEAQVVVASMCYILCKLIRDYVPEELQRDYFVGIAHLLHMMMTSEEDNLDNVSH